MPQANGCIPAGWGMQQCQGMLSPAAKGCGTDSAPTWRLRGAAASCFERLRWRERKRKNSLSLSLLGRVWRARVMPGLYPKCDVGGFVVQEPSSGAAFPYRRITCLPGITQQHLTALIHPPRDWDTCTMMVCDFRGHIFRREQQKR